MSSFFVPGKVIKEFTTKNGRRAVLAYPRWETLAELLTYINTISKEDTYITLSGEELSLKEEAEYLAKNFAGMELGEKLIVHCFVEGKLAGVCDLNNIPHYRKRSEHVRIFGISLAKEFRGEGIGYELASTTISEGVKNFPGLRLITLDCFAVNTAALNLYKKLGFVEVGRKPGGLMYRGEYVDQVDMVYEVKQ